jgi:hypothetical protein
MADFAVDLHGDIRVQGFGLYCFRRRAGRMPALPAISINSLSQLGGGWGGGSIMQKYASSQYNSNNRVSQG